MKVPFLDFVQPYEELKAELDEAYFRCMRSAWYILGREVEAFEQEFAAYCGAKHCIGVGNGLEALHLILRTYKIGEGDEVIVPSNTYIATWLAVSYTGATPVPDWSRTRRRSTLVINADRGGHYTSERKPSCRCIYTGSPPTWSRSWRLVAQTRV